MRLIFVKIPVNKTPIPPVNATTDPVPPMPQPCCFSFVRSGNDVSIFTAAKPKNAAADPLV